MIRTLETLLREIASRRRRQRFHGALAVSWLLIIIASIYLWQSGYSGGEFALGVVAALLVALIPVFFWSRRGLGDPHRIAKTIEKQHPELQTALLAAIEQNPDARGEYSYLQARLLALSLTASERDRWVDRIPQPRLALLTGFNLIALFLFLILACVFAFPKKGTAVPLQAAVVEESHPFLDIVVEPGDVEVERGTAVTIQANFGGVIPSKAVVETKDAEGQISSLELVRPFTGPMYQARIESVSGLLDYKVVVAGGESKTYRIDVFDRPVLVSSEAVLHFPELLEKEPETIKDPRTIRAGEQTRMDLTLVANVPGLTASLVAGKEDPIALYIDPADATRFRFSTILTESVVWRILLTDSKGRTNHSRDTLEIKVIANKAPVVKVVLPIKGDKVTPIQEVMLEATVTDDVGLLATGMNYSLDGEKWIEVNAVSSGEKDSPQISHTVDLEASGAKPNDLIMWNAWAEDVAPDGKVRRVNGDIHVVRVRHFDEEVYQKKVSGGGGSCKKLIKIQTDILNSTWAIRRDHAEISSAPPAPKDLETLVLSQEMAVELASRLESLQTDPADRQVATDAKLEMQDSLEQLRIAQKEYSTLPLEDAIGHQQGALRFLYKLLGNQTALVESEEGGKSDAEQGPKEDLDLKNLDSPYKTEKQAKPEISEEAAEAMRILNRLGELSKRQRDLNEEMKFLQIALNQAQTAAEKAEIERRLRQLREQQKELVENIDELREKTSEPNQKSARQDQKEALDEAREQSRQAKEDLDKEKLGDALAAGRRAEEGLEKLHEDFRKTSAANLANQLRELRNNARELEANQKELMGGNIDKSTSPGLSQSKDSKADAASQKQDFERLVEAVKQTAETAERSEPLVSQDLVKALRQADQDGLGKALEAMANGHPSYRDPEVPAKASEGISNLAREIESAAERILGNEKQALTYARDELRRLAEDAGALPVKSGQSGKEGEGTTPGEGEAPREGKGPGPEGEGEGKAPSEAEGQKPGEGKGQGEGQAAKDKGSTPGEGEGKGQGDAKGPAQGEGKSEGKSEGGEDRSTEAGTDTGRTGGNAITGGEYREWSDRLYDIEAVIEDSDAQTSVARARKASRELRKEYKRHSKPPDQETIEQEILRPLLEAAEKLDARLYELSREDELAPIGRDPVPDRYEEIVRRYFEELGK